jgi:hypothetical protein
MKPLSTPIPMPERDRDLERSTFAIERARATVRTNCAYGANIFLRSSAPSEYRPVPTRMTAAQSAARATLSP